jgi:hypothetical protein
MKNFDRIVFTAVVAIAAVALLIRAPVAAAETYGMRQYVDSKYHCSFWHPRALQVTATTSRGGRSFPDGINVKTLEVGEPGAISVSVVVSPKRMITDEPNGHAARPDRQNTSTTPRQIGGWSPFRKAIVS